MSPFTQHYDIYADETYPDRGCAFALGAIVCTRRRSEILLEQLDSELDRLRYDREVKWSDTSSRNLKAYKAFVDVFFNDRHARFRLMKVVKGAHWRNWARSEEERFFKSYYCFLLRIAGPFSRYHVFVDEQTLQKPYRIDSLRYLLNRQRGRSWDVRGQNVQVLEATDSKSSLLIQLVDLLLGAMTSNARAQAKYELREYIAARMSTIDDRRYQVFDWSPPIS